MVEPFKQTIQVAPGEATNGTLCRLTVERRLCYILNYVRKDWWLTSEQHMCHFDEPDSKWMKQFGNNSRHSAISRKESGSSPDAIHVSGRKPGGAPQRSKDFLKSSSYRSLLPRPKFEDCRVSNSALIWRGWKTAFLCCFIARRMVACVVMNC